MKIRYLLKRRGVKAETHPIFLALYHGDQTEIIYTGERISLAQWSKVDRLPKDQNSPTFKAIEKVKASIAKVIHRLEGDDQAVTPFTVSQAYKSFKKEKAGIQLTKEKGERAGIKSIVSLANQWTENCLFPFKISTQNTVTESIRQFTEYLKISGQASLERKDLNEVVVDGYARYLLEKRHLADSTHGKRMKHLRWFLKSLKYDVQGIKLRSGKKKIIALTLTELQKLEAYDASFDPTLQKAKDMYLLGCYTGQRISDIKRFNADNCVNGFINLVTKKSGGKIEIKIPISKVVADILFRNDQKAPKISEGEVNLSIKKICKNAGITDSIELTITKGGQVITKVVPKCQGITIHTSGKTFISTVATEIYHLTPAETAGVVGKSLKTLLGHYFNLPAESGRSKMIQVENNNSQMKVA